MFDGVEESAEEIEETDEQSFEEINDDNPSTQSNCKSVSRLSLSPSSPSISFF